MKTFCIAGPIMEEDHYFLPNRLNAAELLSYIEKKYYFVLHAPRQSGKTTAVGEFIRHLNGNGAYKALYINIEDAQAARDNVEKALLTILSILKGEIELNFPEDALAVNHLHTIMREHPITLDIFQKAVSYWSRSSSKPIVLFIDEIDSLIGDSLLSVLRQLRTGFYGRPSRFPQSLCLIGLRDVRDYRVWSREQGVYVSTSSPFNIKAFSLTLTNFTQDDIRKLYEQHTEATGQKFTEEAITYAYYLTQGQPWLVNALAMEACFKEVLDRKKPITKEVIEKAKNQLILRRDTHIDSLVDKLNDPRITPIVDAIITGSMTQPSFSNDDLQYTIDLGLISSKEGNVQIANPIYQEIIPAVLAHKFQKSIVEEAVWYQNQDGSINMVKLLQSFTAFYRENSHRWLEDFNYKESGPHILILAFMQRVINGGGLIHREYALGNKRVDLLITWQSQTIVIELKIKYGEDTLAKGLAQTAVYMDLAGATEGHLVLFDRDSTKSWNEKISNELVTYETTQIHVWTL